jgi:hypothetical protein
MLVVKAVAVSFAIVALALDWPILLIPVSASFFPFAQPRADRGCRDGGRRDET